MKYKSTEDYAEMYKSRTEEVKNVLRKNDQNRVNYRLYEEAIDRVTEKTDGIHAMVKVYLILAISMITIVLPCGITAALTSGVLQTAIVIGCAISVASIIIGYILYFGSLAATNDYLNLGNPYANGKIPTTKNKYLRKSVNKYKIETEKVFAELKKDEEKSLNAIFYNMGACEAVGDIDVYSPLKKILKLVVMYVSVFVLGIFALPSGNVSEAILIIAGAAALIYVLVYAMVIFPTRSSIRIELRNENPYITDE